MRKVGICSHYSCLESKTTSAFNALTEVKFASRELKPLSLFSPFSDLYQAGSASREYNIISGDFTQSPDRSSRPIERGFTIHNLDTIYLSKSSNYSQFEDNLRLGLALLKMAVNWSQLDLPVAPLKIYLPDCDAPDICYLHLVSGVDGKVDGGAVGDPHIGHPCPVLVQDRPLQWIKMVRLKRLLVIQPKHLPRT